MKKRAIILVLALAGCAGALSGGGGAQAETARATTAPDPVKGKQVYVYWCAECHDRGPGHPGTQSLEVKYHGSPPAALEDRTDLLPAVTAYFVRNGSALMPPFRKTEISDADLQDLAAYLAKNSERKD